jgi:VIT1/CCC1 family predicted Fe2+/Mn2+ transporter
VNFIREVRRESEVQRQTKIDLLGSSRLMNEYYGMPVSHRERHRTERIGWIRAAVLGANDGILSTASLVLGVAAAHGSHSNVLVAGVTGLAAGE